MHYEDTIRNRVPLARVASSLLREEVSALQDLFGPSPMAVWGSRDSPANRSKFARMRAGDSLLIVEGGTIKFMGKIALKTINARLSRELWRNLDGTTDEGWDLVYFIANPIEIGVPFKAFCRLLGYEENFQLRGLTVVAQERLEQFYFQYDDLYSILVRIRDGERIEKKRPGPPIPPIDPTLGEGRAPAPSEPITSAHLEIQCKLAKLGAKGGQKVWVPIGDRLRLRRVCDFEDFEREFAPGIDMPLHYVENIDVVWKEQFRIDAAFEVENTTGIYSGLLRFADLSIVAPNSLYPLFIVAPGQRHEEVRRQVQRPSFEVLKMKRRVLFLPYEEVNEVERFFVKGGAGPTVEVMKARAVAFG